MKNMKILLGILLSLFTVSLLFTQTNTKVEAQTEPNGWLNSDQNIYFDGGNVGINTTDPQYSLDVGGRLMRLSGDLPAFILNDVHEGGESWAMYSGAPTLGDFKLRQLGEKVDRLVINGEHGYLTANTRLLSLQGNLPALVLNDNRTSGGDWAIYSGSPDLGDFKIRDNNHGKNKFIIKSDGSVCLGNC